MEPRRSSDSDPGQRLDKVVDPVTRRAVTLNHGVIRVTAAPSLRATGA